MEIYKILKAFYEITGARVSLHDADAAEIAAYPSTASFFCASLKQYPGVRDLCIHADKSAFEKVKQTGSTYKYKCHCGLIEMIAPVYHYGVLSGFVMLGQISDTHPLSQKNIQTSIQKYVTDPVQMDGLCRSVPKVTDEILESCMDLFTVVASYLTHQNAVRPTKDDRASGIKKYIHRHYGEEITVPDLCLQFECSRATLMNSFKEKYGCTLFSYLNQYRIKKAAEQIKGSDRPVKDIALSCGFTDPAYFSKVFRKTYRCTPTAFRENTQ